MAPRERATLPWAWAWACVAWACVAWVGGARASGLCSDGAAFHSLVAVANASGHWHATLALQQDARVQHGAAADTLRLDVRPAASLCGDVRTVAMTVELRGSSPVIHIANSAAAEAAAAAAAAAVPPPGLGYARAPAFPSFYKAHAARVNWREAHAACEAEGAHLAVVESPEEAQAVAFLLRAHRATPPAPALTPTLHAGFFATDARYYSVLGDPLAELEHGQWAAGEPRHVDICGAVDHAGRLHDAFCSWNVRRSFLCEFGGPPAAARGARRALRAPAPPRAPLSPSAAPAPADRQPFTRLPGAGAFQVRAENATWAEAQAACQRAGGQLAVAETRAEADALRRHLADGGGGPPLPPQLHVGLFADSRFVTVFGDDLSDSEYQGWADGEPNNHPCVVANHDLSYSSVGCGLKTAFICEQADTV